MKCYICGASEGVAITKCSECREWYCRDHCEGAYNGICEKCWTKSIEKSDRKNTLGNWFGSKKDDDDDKKGGGWW